MTCSCSRLQIGSKLTDLRNWNPECAEHGLKSAWYHSDEQVNARKEQSARLKQLYAKVKAARACNSHTGTNCKCQEAL